MLEDDSYELYVSMGGKFLNRESYRKVVKLVNSLAFLFLSKGKVVVLDDISFVPCKRKRTPKDAVIRYYQYDYVPDIDVKSKKWKVCIDPKAKKEIVSNYENLVL